MGEHTLHSSATGNQRQMLIIQSTSISANANGLHNAASHNDYIVLQTK